MKICGYIENSFVDYPGEIAAVIFTPGCNMKCDYCHNWQILNHQTSLLNEEAVLKELILRKNFVSSIVITGGEPTLQPDLQSFIKKLKNLGFKIKLDTNGLKPEVIKLLLKEKCLDYIAMDFKSPLNEFPKVTGLKEGYKKVKESAEIIKNSGVKYEFRTTFNNYLKAKDIEKIAGELQDASNYYIQNFRVENTKEKPKNALNNFCIALDALHRAKKFIPNSQLRGY